MELIAAIKQRKSVRGYLPKAVPEDVVREIIETARRAPSAVNTQPWEITVITGPVLDGIRKESLEKLRAGVPNTENSRPYDMPYKARSRELGIELFRLMEIERGDTVKRTAWMERGFRFFDAPVAIIVSADKVLVDNGTWAVFDCGALCQTMALAALEYGLGTCIEEAGVTYRDVIRKHAGIAGSKAVVMGIALGYPDPAFPANAIESTRVPFDEAVRMIGY